MSGSFNKADQAKVTPNRQHDLSKKNGRRMSSQGPGESTNSSASSQLQSKDLRMPLTAVLSEDHLSSPRQQQKQQQQQQPKQSLLSKFTSRTPSESKTATSATPTTSSGSKNSKSIHGTDCDIATATTTNTSPTKHDDNYCPQSRLANEQRRPQQQQIDDSKQETEIEAEVDDFKLHEEEEDDDDNDKVVPEWPSRKDVEARRNSQAGGGAPVSNIQHQVYSLRDYSQVANPSPSINTTLPVSVSSGKLLKSMSQDRKIKANTKRLSECIYPNSGIGIVSSTSTGKSNKLQQRNPSVTSQTPTVSFPMAPASSVNSLLSGPTASQVQAVTTTRHAALLSESRMDRMRKLFVSPLSLRSSSNAGASGSGGLGGSGNVKVVMSAGVSSSASSEANSAAHRGATSNPRLSLQSSTSSMLKQPHHHLMHAMYRTKAGHHSRRSPMRQKQSKTFRVYGCPLHMANNIYPITCFGRADIYKQQAVPYILARLCNYIEENSSHLTHEGIFRVSGNARLMEKLRTLFDRLGDAPLELESVDVATSASMLKMYLRELPEPLIPSRMNYHFISLAKKYSSFLAKNTAAGYKFDSPSVSDLPSSTAASNEANQAASIERNRVAFLRDLTKLVRKLPIENYNLLKYLACFLYRISLKQHYNKMCAEALGIVFGPNVFRIRSESYKGLKEQEMTNQIMASIIGNYKSLFDSELTDPLGNLVECDELVSSNNTDKLTIAGANVPPSETEATSSQVTEMTDTTTTTNSTTATKQQSSAVTRSSSPLPTTPQQVAATSGEAILNAEYRNESPSRLQTISPTPAQSSSYHLNDVHSCCAKHCRRYLFESRAIRSRKSGRRRRRGCSNSGMPIVSADHVGIVCDGDDPELDEDEEIDDDDEEESYTPSSESDSYCSSIDSDTIESSFGDRVEGYGDDDVEGEEDEEDTNEDSVHDGNNNHHDHMHVRGGADDEEADNGDDDEIAGLESHSSSQCASDTSYTPSSSHTEESAEDDEEGEDDDRDQDEDEDKDIRRNAHHKRDKDKRKNKSKNKTADLLDDDLRSLNGRHSSSMSSQSSSSGRIVGRIANSTLDELATRDLHDDSDGNLCRACKRRQSA